MGALLIDRFAAAAARAPEAVAIATAERAIPYRVLEAYAARAVRHFQAQGVQPGMTVALAMGQSPIHLIAMLALQWMGVLAVPFAGNLRPEDRAALAAKYGIRFFVMERNEALPWGCRPVLLHTVGAVGDETLAGLGERPFGPDTPARLALTSGTTGTPKGVLHTHASLAERLDRMHFDVAEVPVVLAPGLAVTVSMLLCLHALTRGGTVVFPRDYGNDAYFEALRRHRVTHVALPPANLALMLEALPDGGPGFPDVRMLRLLGHAPWEALLEGARRRFSERTYAPYATTEIGVVSMATPETLRADPTGGGRLEPGVRFEALDDAGRALPPGRSGEVRVSVPGMPAGYHGPDAADRTRFRDGWFYPGDRGMLTAEGMVRIDGRSDDVINTGGRKVAPDYVEAVLMDFPGVREAAAFAHEGSESGKRIAAAIVASAPIDWRALHRHALDRLELAAPVCYFRLESLPRGELGKLDRKRLPHLEFPPPAFTA